MAADALVPDPTPESANQSASQQQPLKKRRRRTTAGGATDDCFACRKRGARCDRKRPYCSQCIDTGKDCPGYKTTLTWGVGVASRGKLRGLACPVANKNVDGSDITASEAEARRRKSSTTTKVKREEGTGPSASSYPLHSSLPTQHVFSIPTSVPRTGQSYPPSASPQSPAGWPHPMFSHGHSIPNDDRFFHHVYRNPSLQRLQTQFGSPFDHHAMSASVSSVGSWHEADPRSSVDFAQTPDSVAFSDHLSPGLLGPFIDQPLSGGTSTSFEPRNSIDSYMNDHLSTSIDSLSSATSYGEPSGPLSRHGDINPIDNFMFNSTDFSHFNVFESAIDDSEPSDDNPDLGAIDPRFNSPYFHLSPRLASLLSYYDQEICPQLVTVDGPENPYRKHILPLAMSNEGLQNAIAALVTNNLRMRRKGPSKQADLTNEATVSYDVNVPQNSEEASPEEALYRKMSIDQLNLQLIDARAAQDDSVLATLLILCLFHVCDSGFSKFKTQLSGMQKLLSLRQGLPQSDLSNWVELFFAWFDVFTSTVNDREVQIRPDTLDMLEKVTASGTLEQFSGCDFKLFKQLARLGRLNLLAQGRPVKARNHSRAGRTHSMAQVPTLSTYAHFRKTSAPTRYPLNRSLTAQDYAQVDGNGWGAPIFTCDQEEIDATSDTRAEFWAEWHDVRRNLRLWQPRPDLHLPEATANAGPIDLEQGKQDLVHINECLRLAALLYTERLGAPLLPSAHEQFQNLVSQAFYHIANLSPSSCVGKFMLWPLFIIGTECVDEGHRHFLRSRCLEIQQKSGFSNNVAALEVLERVWRETPANEDDEVELRSRCSSGDNDGRPGQPFVWRKVMNRMDGEYLVI